MSKLSREIAEHEERVLTPFQKWLRVFIEEKEIDMSEPVTAGDGTVLRVGDVMTAINSTGPQEQAGIKNMLVMIDFRNGSVYDYIKHLAQALDASHQVTAKDLGL